MEEVRLNKFLSEAGFCSRREADKRIEAGQVTIDGELAKMGSKVMPGQEVKVLGKIINRDSKPILIAFNKPIGIVCTSEKREKDNIIDYIKYPSRIYPIGRLDKNSEGLILLTNQGDIVNKMMRSGNAHEKEYLVTVNKNITEDFLNSMANGVSILDTVTRKCKVKKVDNRRFKIILTQGLNRQIRRMCEALGYKVMALKRIRVMNITLNDLPIGKYRDITEAEWEELSMLIKDSSNEPVFYEGDFAEE